MHKQIDLFLLFPVCDVFFLVSPAERTHLLLSGSHVSLVARRSQHLYSLTRPSPNLCQIWKVY